MHKFFFLGKYIPRKPLGTSSHFEDGTQCKVDPVDYCTLTSQGHRVGPT